MNRKCRPIVAVVITALLVVALTLLVAAPATGAPASFPDVPAAHPYYTAIIGLADQGIISGYTNGNFGPQDLVMRQQFAKMICGAFGLTVQEGLYPCPFTDVEKPAGNTYPDDFVAAAYHFGITLGKTASTFEPSANITRAQVISMVVRAADNLDAGTLTAVPDGWSGQMAYTDPNHGANIKKAEYNGLLSGIQCGGDLGTWGVYANASRAEVAQILWNLIGLLAPADPNEGKSWGDPTMGREAPSTTVDVHDFISALLTFLEMTPQEFMDAYPAPGTEELEGQAFVQYEADLAERLGNETWAHELARVALVLGPRWYQVVAEIPIEFVSQYFEPMLEAAGEASCWKLEGEISVGVVFVESSDPNSPAIFSESEVTSIQSKIVAGLNWLKSEAPAGANLSFVVEQFLTTIDAVDGTGECRGFLGLCCCHSCKESYWRDPAMTKINYYGNTYGADVDSVNEFREDMRQHNGSAHAVVIFVAAYESPWFGYAFPDDGRITLAERTPDYQNFGNWGIAGLNNMTAHEVCHLFGGADEYIGSGTPCSSCTSRHGCFRIRNGNCQSCNSAEGRGCVMDVDSTSVCPWTQAHIGWADVFVEVSTQLQGAQQPFSEATPVYVELAGRKFYLDCPDHQDWTTNVDAFAFGYTGITPDDVNRVRMGIEPQSATDHLAIANASFWVRGEKVCNGYPTVLTVEQPWVDFCGGNKAPIVDAGPDRTGQVGWWEFMATFHDPELEDTHTATLSVDGGPPIAMRVVEEFGGRDHGSLWADVQLSSGIHNIDITVTDNYGGSDTDTLIATVQGAPPLVDAGPDRTGPEGEWQINATFTDADLDDTHPTAYMLVDNSERISMSVVEPTRDSPGEVRALAKADLAPGWHVITITVFDNTGLYGNDSVVVTAELGPRAPVVDAGPDRTLTPGQWGFTADFTDANLSDTHTAGLRVDGGSPITMSVVEPTAQSPGHVTGAANLAEGTHTVTITVRDQGGLSGSDTVLVTVVSGPPNHPPVLGTISFSGADQNGYFWRGAPVNAGVSFTDTDSGDTHTATWYWGDGTSSAGSVSYSPIFGAKVTGTHTWATKGWKTVTIQLNDNHGGTDQATATIYISGID